MSRPYTGTSEGVGGGKRPGLEHFVASLQHRTGGRLWNNGTYGIRQKRGSSSRGLSVHSTGRAGDISRRPMGDHRTGCDRAYLEKICAWLVDHADDIGLELLIDYQPAPGGRGWKCDRQAWQTYPKGTVAGGGFGDWIHIELDPEHADSEDWVAAVIATLPDATPVDTSPAGPKPYPGTTTRRASRATARVRDIQGELLNAGHDPGPLDGVFGSKTDTALRAFQQARGLTVDGIVGPATWAALFG
jgi:hypothetical protein